MRKQSSCETDSQFFKHKTLNAEFAEFLIVFLCALSDSAVNKIKGA